MTTLSLIEQLIDALRCLPGVGPKSAQRMAFHILERNKAGGAKLAQALNCAINQITHCKRCNTLSDNDLCRICRNPERDGTLLCVVETPADVIAIEQTRSYNGLYFVLMGHLSPLDGIGPEEIGVKKLTNTINEHDIKEIILATNPTSEGEATAHYLSNVIENKSIKCTRIACGIPVGGEMEYLDRNTLARALKGRIDMERDQ